MPLIRVLRTAIVAALFCAAFNACAQDTDVGDQRRASSADQVTAFCDDMKRILADYERRNPGSWIDHLQYMELAQPLVAKYPADIILRAHERAMLTVPQDLLSRTYNSHPRFYCGAIALISKQKDTARRVTQWISEGCGYYESKLLFVGLSYAPAELIRGTTEDLIAAASPEGKVSAEEAALAGSLLAICGDTHSLQILQRNQSQWPDFRKEGGTNGPPLSTFAGDGQIYSGDITYLKHRLARRKEPSAARWNELELWFFRWSVSGPPEDPTVAGHDVDNYELVADRMRRYPMVYPTEFLRTKWPRKDAKFFEGYTIGTSLADALATYDNRRREFLRRVPGLWQQAAAGDFAAAGTLGAIEDPVALNTLRDAIRASVGDEGQTLNEEVIWRLSQLGGEENKKFLQELSQDERLSEHERKVLAAAATAAIKN